MNFKLIAIFIAQAVVDGQAVNVEPQGPTSWDVTAEIEEGDIEGYLSGPNENTDTLRDTFGIPAWALNWIGPYSIKVEKMDASEAAVHLAAHGLPGSKKRYIATFVPQAWVNNHAITVDAGGCCTWDVTADIPVDQVTEYLADRSTVTDKLQLSSEAPDWIKRWNGPFALTVEEMDNADACALLAERGPTKWDYEVVLMPNLSELIPNSDGLLGRGYRHGLESMALALQAEGVDPRVINRALQTSLDAYGNNIENVSGPEEIESILVVSTAHLHPNEREDIEGGIFNHEHGVGPSVEFKRDYGWMVHVSKPLEEADKEPFDQFLLSKSEGFHGVIKRAIDLGLSWVMFDCDAPTLDGIESYEDDGSVAEAA